MNALNAVVIFLLYLALYRAGGICTWTEVWVRVRTRVKVRVRLG